MSLGIGHSITKYTAVYFENKYGLLFDGSDDYALAGISGNDPADGTIKPLTGGLTVAAWVKLDIDGDDNPYDSVPSLNIVGSNLNGGWRLFYQNRKFQFNVKLVDAGGNTATTVPVSNFAKLKAPTGGTDYARYLYKSDGWHFVVGTWDGNRVKQIYVDGGRDQAGDTDGSSATNFGSQPEDSGSKKTEAAASSGTWFILYDTTSDRDEIDVIIGATPNYTAATNVTVGSGNFWEGNIGDVAVWDKELTSAEITTLYNLHVPIDMSTIQKANLQGYWKAEEGTGTVLTDSSGNVGANGALYNDVAWSTTVPSLDVTGYAGYL